MENKQPNKQDKQKIKVSYEHIKENCKTIEDLKKLNDEVLGNE